MGGHATLITSQLPVENWHAYQNDPPLADAILDRMSHATHKLALSGETQRKRPKASSRPPALWIREIRRQGKGLPQSWHILSGISLRWVIILNSENAKHPAEEVSPPVSRNIGPFPYCIALMSIMPGLGVILGPVALVWGLATLKRGGKLVAAIGAMGFGSQSLFFIVVVHKLFA